MKGGWSDAVACATAEGAERGGNAGCAVRHAMNATAIAAATAALKPAMVRARMFRLALASRPSMIWKGIGLPKRSCSNRISKHYRTHVDPIIFSMAAQ
jgi:hypothetical protein